MAAPERQKIEEIWLARLRDAKLRLDFARNYAKEVQKDYTSLPATDGQYALQRALRAENLALAEYNRVLRIYADLTTGIMRNEDDWPLSKRASTDD